MGLRDQIGKELVKVALRVVLPFIESLLKNVLKFAFEKIQRFVTKTMSRREREASANAAEARERAEAASDPIEAARQQGREEVWREVAAHYNVDASELKAELSRIRAEARSEARSSINEMRDKQLPQLPPPPADAAND
ncbi:hypothetical protein [Paraburkholderia youngii]|uniref:hypothetical protein n=1 Tax=Paraburkholderia youngii TaxID=2782701 RepID=UPI003D1EE487